MGGEVMKMSASLITYLNFASCVGFGEYSVAANILMIIMNKVQNIVMDDRIF